MFKHALRALVVCTLTFMLTAFTLTGLAQTAPQSAPQAPASTPPSLANNWFGLRLGYVNPAYPFGAMIHFGTRDPFGTGLRLSASYQPGNTGAAWGFGGDGLTPVSSVNGLTFYTGGGGGVFFEGRSFLLDAHGLLGSEFRFSQVDADQLGLFLEVQLGAALAIGNNIDQPRVPTIGVLFGFNIYF